ncbi:carbon starvation protein A [Natranaerobius thermophilus]|uniref:Carbon starvation protein CstA n=1 Tax=Natranaerobius thermophilus (strain ATCC BAA-1301 / DSM 18059 / JW/NM-WN-LF) TaxID=457570 RepID=B2A422_NATTJ|nr:carbon starvation protein A [Natranaerobius thermophilus]ACB85124.1 carbon starvation protein CstA [Natranaerobius thermophilus JW/NM-WN-LF]
MSLGVLLIGIICFVIAFATYGAWLAKQWGVDPSRTTPAHALKDDLDYVPAKSPVLLGHHFSSIAGAAPIVGPITASMWGWAPVALWIILGSIFIGGVQDFGSLLASARHDGRSIGDVIKSNIGESGKKLFSVFAWLTLILIVAAFANIVADTFVATPEAATASVLFIILAIVFGFTVNKGGIPLPAASVIGVILLFVCIWIGTQAPLVIPHSTWMIILLVYIFIASITPVWILLQPRDYLNSFLLYIMIIGAFIGLIFYRPDIQLPAVTSFNVDGELLFPILFVTVACGAISGFHSLVGSGTTSKQLDNEKDTKLVGYGSMLLEGVLALIALITAAYLASDVLDEFMAEGPIYVFSHGIGTFISQLGVDFTLAQTFGALAISAFALTSLDTATRLSRFIFQEYFAGDTPVPEAEKSGNPLTNRYVTTIISVIVAGTLAFYGWEAIWPIFGSANQLLASLAFLAMATWMVRLGKNNNMFIYPMIFMALVTLCALLVMIYTNFPGNLLLVFISAVLFILAIVLFKQAYQILIGNKTIDS